jgi:acyl-CoA dehydrogenase
VNGQRDLLLSTVARLFEADLTPARRAQAEQNGWCGEFWNIAVTMGLPLLLVGEAAGGFDGSLEDACAVARLAGRYAVPAPLVEDFLARGLLAEAGLTPPDGLITLAVSAEVSDSNGIAQGIARAVPWGRLADHVLVDANNDGQSAWLLLSVRDATVRTAHSLAGEPSDDLLFDGAKSIVVDQGRTNATLLDRLTPLRVSQMAGALEAALALAIDHANNRVQFGRPIGKFQAVQQQLALMAEEAAATSAVAEALSRTTAGAPFETAAAKLRANRAIDVAVPIAHQTLGAIGFTAEHGLHRLTQRLLWWRSECGGDRYWATKLGGMVVARGAASLWSDLTARTDALEVVR